MAQEAARAHAKDESKASVPRDPQLYFRLVKLYLDTPEDLRIPRAIVRAFQKMIMEEGYQGKVPAIATLESWAYNGVKLPVMKRPMSLQEIAAEYKAGEFDIERLLLDIVDDLEELSGQALRDALKQVRRVLATDSFKEKADADPRIVFTAVRTLDDVNARATPKASGEWDLDSVDRERAMEIIAELLQGHPDLARAVGNVCQVLLDQAAEDAAVDAGQNQSIRAENGPNGHESASIHDILSGISSPD